MTVEEILAAIGAYVGDDKAKAKEFAKQLRSTAETKPVAQLLLNAGAGKKAGETDTKVSELQGKVDALTEEKTELEEQLETAKKQPNEQQAAWDREREKLVKRAEKAETERDTEKSGRGQDAVTLARARFRTALIGKVDDFGLDALEARTADRFKLKEDRTVEILSLEDDDIIDAPKGKHPAEILAEQALAKVPAGNRLKQMNAGGGSSSGGGGSVTQLTPDQLDEEKRRSYQM